MLSGFFFILIFGLHYLFRDYSTKTDLLFEKFNQDTQAASVLFLGNSHVVPLSEYHHRIRINKTASLAYGSSDLFLSMTILKKYITRLPKVTTVIIGVDPEMIGYNESKSGQQYIFRTFYKYTDTLYYDNLLNRFLATNCFFRTNRDIGYLFSGEDGRKKKVAKQNNESFSQTECRNRAQECSVLLFNKNNIPENLSFLQEIIKLCKINNKDLIVFNSPKRACYKSFRSKENYDYGKRSIEKLLISNEMNYLDADADSTFNDVDFRDPDHLNDAGCHKLLERLGLIQ